MRRIILGLCAGLVLALVPSLSVGATDPNQELLNKYLWPPVPPIGQQDSTSPILGYRFGIVDDFTQGAGGEATSFLTTGGALQPLCSGFDDAVCIREVAHGEHWGGVVVLPPCQLAQTSDACVEGVKVIDAAGSRELIFKSLISGPMWSADANHGDVPGSEPSLWRDPADADPTHGYKVTAGGGLSVNPTNTALFHSNLFSFQSNVSAYQEVKGPYRGYAPFTTGGVTRAGWGAGPGCIWAETGVCGAQVNFAAGTRIQLRVHIPTTLSSWMIGRISNPSIAVSDLPASSMLKRISIEANPVEVPLFQVEVPIEKASESLKKAISAPDNPICNPTFSGCQHGYIGGNTSTSYPTAFTGYELFKDYLDQKAGIMMPTWSVRTLVSGNGNSFNGCLTNGFSGLVTTNSSIYEGNPPSWDGASLNYKVAGVHLDPQGNVFQGSYDLILKSDLARCLYKLSKAPISATISVVDVGGSSTVTTSSFSESNGWAHMLARGFTFSSPTLIVKFKQDAVSATPSTQPVVQAQKKITITCIKNKVTKMVTGVKPVCPAGYKKK